MYAIISLQRKDGEYHEVSFLDRDVIQAKTILGIHLKARLGIASKGQAYRAEVYYNYITGEPDKVILTPATEPYPTERKQMFPLTLLRGHTSPETAYVVEDYPYGSLRCKIRYWIEFGTKGAGKGQFRFGSQTTNPKRGHSWNNPKYGTYNTLLFMYLDTRNNHVLSYGMHHPWSNHVTKFQATGLYQQMNEDERALFDGIIADYRQSSPKSWKDWDEKVEAVRAAADDFGHENLYDKFKGIIYESDFETIIAFLKAEKGIYTPPTQYDNAKRTTAVNAYS